MIKGKIVGIGVNPTGGLELLTESGDKIIEECVPVDEPISYLLRNGYTLLLGVLLGPESCEDINYQEVLSDLNASFRDNLIKAYSEEAKNDKREN